MCTIRPKNAQNGTGAKGGLFQTLCDTLSAISQLFSALTSLAHCGCFVKFWTRLTSPIFTMLLVSFFGFSGTCVFVQKVLKCIIENTPRKSPVFGDVIISMIWFIAHPGDVIWPMFSKGCNIFMGYQSANVCTLVSHENITIYDMIYRTSWWCYMGDVF